MECPICGEELIHEEYFCRIMINQGRRVFGDIYRCPNGSAKNEKCKSEYFSVAGSFYAYWDDPDRLLECHLRR